MLVKGRGWNCGKFRLYLDWHAEVCPRTPGCHIGARWESLQLSRCCWLQRQQGADHRPRGEAGVHVGPGTVNCSQIAWFRHRFSMVLHEGIQQPLCLCLGVSSWWTSWCMRPAGGWVNTAQEEYAGSKTPGNTAFSWTVIIHVQT